MSISLNTELILAIRTVKFGFDHATAIKELLMKGASPDAVGEGHSLTF